MNLRFINRLRPTRHIAWLFAVVGAASGLLLYRLYSLTPGLAASEVALPPFKTSLDLLWNQPVEAPILLTRLLVAMASPSTGALLSRLPSVLLAICLIVAAYWLMQRWYGQRLAVFGALLLSTSPWLLHVGRLAINDIVYPLAMMLLLAALAAWHQKTWRIRTYYSSALLIALLAYVPGMLLLIAAVIIFEQKNILKVVRSRSKHALIATGILLIGLVPLIHSIFVSPKIISTYIGLPNSFPTPVIIAKNILQTWQHIFIGGLQDPLRNLGNLPIITTFISMSFIIGVYLYAKHLKATRTKQLVALWILGSILIAFDGPVQLSLLLPIVHILAIGGIGYLLHMWLKTFPRNPYARVFGISLLGIVVLFAVAYNVRSYYLAWPNTPAVRATFTRQL